MRAPLAFALVTGTDERVGRVVDSGASLHFTSDRSLFNGPTRSVHIPVGGISGQLTATEVGPGCMVVAGVMVDLPELYYIHGLDTTLISMSQLVESGCQVSVAMDGAANTMSITTKAGETASVVAVNGMYFCAAEGPPFASAALAIDGVTVGNTHAGPLSLTELLHRRLGHHSWGSKRFADRVRCALGRKDIGVGHNMAACDACCRTKIKREYCRDPPTRPARRPLERVHFDFVPQLRVAGVDGHTNFLLVVDEFTEMLFAYPMHSKAELPAILESFRVSSERHFREKLGTVSWPVELASIRSDGEAVNVSGAIRSWCSLHGVIRELSAPYAQFQNGKVERAIQSVWRGAEAMRVAAGAPCDMWPFTLQAFIHVRNRLALGVSDLSPWERWHMTTVPLEVRIAMFRVWGSLCYKYDPLSRKLEDTGRPGVLLGYSSESKAYIFLDLETRAISTTAYLVCNEVVMPLLDSSWRDHQAANPEPVLLGRPPASHTGAGTLCPSVPVNTSPLATPPGDRLYESDDPATWDPPQDHPAPGRRTLELQVVPSLPPPTGGHTAGGIEAAFGTPSLHAPPSSTAALREAGASVAPAPRLKRSGRADGSFHPPVRTSSRLSGRPKGKPTRPPMRVGLRPRTRRQLAAPADWFEDRNLASPGPSTGSAVSSDDASCAEDDATHGFSGMLTARDSRSHRLAGEATMKHLQMLEDMPHLDSPLPPARVVPVPVVLRDGSAPGPKQRALCARLCNVSVCPPPLTTLNGIPLVRGHNGLASVRRRLSRAAHERCLPGAEVARLEALADDLLFAPPGTHLAMLADLVDVDRVLSHTAPKTVAEAEANINNQAWRQAMEAELKSMSEFGVWRLVPPPPGVRPLGNKWVFKVKTDKAGLVEKLKARLTLQGFAMQEGRDYDETWAPTGRLRTFRAMIAEVACCLNMKTAQWDCTCAFLHAVLDKVVYMKQPPGHAEPGKEHYVCELVKAIYGTKQASRLFCELVRKTLLSFGASQRNVTVTRSRADDCLFLVSRGAEVMRILTHVDDFAVSYNSDALYDLIFGLMCESFKITDYGRKPISLYCGIAVSRSPDGAYTLSQTAYIREVLERLGVQPGQAASSPERTGGAAKLQPLSGPLSPADAAFMQQVPYREAVGAVWYIARATRFDIFRATQEVARFVANPGPVHWQAVQRLLLYLQRTADKPMVYKPASFTDRALRGEGLDARLVAHSDSDWAGDKTTSKSRTGWLVHWGGCLVAWRSVVQKSVAQSSCEAEYIAGAAVANEVVWWRRLCAELGYPMHGATPIRCDNAAACNLAKHSGNFEATKHFLLKYHVLRQYQEEGITQTTWCPTASQLADILTKNVAVKTFRRIASTVLGCTI